MKEIKNCKQGFTLLELLVVVLIIGILASIALPQYKKAVARAELTQIITKVKAISNAQDRYYLVNGTYATDMEYLDIDLDNKITCRITFENWVDCYNTHLQISHYYANSSLVNRTECCAKDKVFATACEAFTGVQSHLLESGGSCFGLSKPCYMTWGVLPI